MTGLSTRAAERRRIPTGQARRLLADITADPHTPVVVSVSGPAGTGKTGLLAAVGEVYRRADVPAVLVDDAHTMAAGELADLGRCGSKSLVVAYRPWPLPSGIAGLARTRPEIRLGDLDRTGLTARVTEALGSEPDMATVEQIATQTGGNPMLVEHAIEALRTGVRIGELVVTQAGLDIVLAELDRLSPVVHDLLLGLALGADATADDIAELLSISYDEATDALRCAWSAGLLDDSGRIIGLAADAVARTAGAIVRREFRHRIAEIQLARGGAVLPTGRLLLHTGARGQRVAEALIAAGDEALVNSAALAAELFEGAVAAGADPAALAARRAEAAVLSGDPDGALRLAEQALANVNGADHDRAASVAATVLAQRGMLACSAALCRTTAAPSGAAVTALIGVGDLAAARDELTALETAGPGLLHTVHSLVARGVHHTVTGPALVGLSELVQASRLLGDRAHVTVLPEPPAALAALVALHVGEPDTATCVLNHALADQPSCSPALVRCRLLTAWIALQRGELAVVHKVLAELAPIALQPRDELYAAALAVGAARRSTDLASLRAAWPRARDAVLAHAVDLYVLQPLGEIAVAAAKLGEDHLVAGHLAEAEALLARLGGPALWSAPLHWHGLHAAIAAEEPTVAVRHARALTAMTDGGRCVAALSRAAESWLRVLAGHVDVAVVTAAARELQSVGLAWDGARLAGQAAVRTTDRKAMATLLCLARALHDETKPDDQPTTETLSNRELEVAALLIEGMTYKQIGERLFLSAKTVEHHIARIRRRLGDPARRELLARLRVIVAETGTSQD